MQGKRMSSNRFLLVKSGLLIKVLVSLLLLNVAMECKAKAYFSAGYSILDFEESTTVRTAGTPYVGEAFTVEEYSDVDTSGLPLKLMIGIQFASVYALEISYLNLGDFKYDYKWENSFSGTDLTTIYRKTEFSGYALGVSNVFTINTGASIKLLGKVGAILSQGDSLKTTTAQYTGSVPQTSTVSGDFDEVALELGLGAKYIFTDKVSATLDVTRSNGMLENLDLTKNTLAINYKF